MKKTIFILGTISILSIGCTKSIDYERPSYVSSAEYKKLSCKKLKEVHPYYNDIPCKKLKEKLFFIFSSEYEKLSCKQLNEELIKINERLDVRSDVEAEATALTVITVPILIATGLIVPVTVDSSSYSGDTTVSESDVLNDAYKSIKKVATKKNCSFALDMK